MEIERREKIPIFRNNEADKLLLNSFEDILALNKRYSWIEGENPKGKLLFQHFARAAKGKPLQKLRKLTEKTSRSKLGGPMVTFQNIAHFLDSYGSYKSTLTI